MTDLRDYDRDATLIEKVRDLERQLADAQAVIEQLRGAMQADDDRLYEAGERVGLFHGCDTADAMAQDIERLRNELAAAQAVIEQMRDALDWYADEARACAKNSEATSGAQQHALLASVTVLALDGGRRADSVLAADQVRSAGPFRQRR